MPSVQQDQVTPHGVIERLPLYLNSLIHLRNEGCGTVSSARLSELTEVNPAQIRRDLAHFGHFGLRGVGYDTGKLAREIQQIIGADREQLVAVVGAGHLGCAMVQYDGLRTHGFVVDALFDNDSDKIGTTIAGIVVSDVADIEEIVAQRGIRFGVLAVPADVAQAVADRLCAAGIRAIINYSTAFVVVPETVALHNTDPARELLHTLYYLTKSEGMAGAKR